MGRPYRGTDYVGAGLSLEVGHLRRNRIIVQGQTVKASFRWGSGEVLDIESNWTREEPTLSLSFLDTDRESWTQRIAMRTAQSPLQGTLLYFVCPRSGKTCRKLYRAYYSRGFFHREAFTYRLYYPQQGSCKMKLPDRQLQAVERKLSRLKAKRRTSTYLGQPTRRAVRIAQLQEEAFRLEELRWSPEYVPKSFLGLFSKLL